MSNLKTQAKYHERRTEVEYKLKAIAEMIKNHRDNAGNNLHRGHIGDLAHVVDGLDDIIEFLGS